MKISIIVDRVLECPKWWNTNAEAELTAKIVDGEMLIEEWGDDKLSRQNWVLSCGHILFATGAEMVNFWAWFAPITAIAGILGDKMLSTADVAKASGVTPARVRQLAPKIPHALKTQHGWLFPPSAVDFVKSQPPPGPVPKAEDRKRFNVSPKNRNKIASITLQKE